MNFTSPAFVFGFPLVLAVHWAMPARWRWAWLLAASVMFYAVGSRSALPLLVAVTLGTYISARGIEAAQSRRAKRLWCALAVALCMGSLAVFKYAGLLGFKKASLLPAGISFYTFQTLAYVLDVARGRQRAERHLGLYALFVCFFPQLVAGPIERSGDLLPQLKSETRTLDVQGVLVLLRGFAKKLLLADAVAPFVDAVYAAPGAAGGPRAVLATALFAAQIYFDFSGYSDIARGAAALLGVRLRENFDRPYAAKTPREFWRRWHMSLNAWLTDYLYIPLGGSRRGLARQCVNLLLVFALSGLWHGAAGHYVVWGIFHGLVCVGQLLVERRAKRALPLWASHGLTLAAVGLGWVFFRAESVSAAADLLASAATGWSIASVGAALAALGGDTALRLALGSVCVRLLPVPLAQPCDERRKAYPLAVLLLAVAVGSAWLASLDGAASAFLYFQF